jgi:prefoldin beta subunit
MAEKKEGKKTKGVVEDPNKIAAQFQIMQQQLQNIMIQKESLRLNTMEIERAVEELGKSSDKTAYKIAGPIMVSKPVEDIKKDLKDTKEALKVRMESLEKTEKRLTDKLKELQEKLKEILK